MTRNKAVSLAALWLLIAASSAFAAPKIAVSVEPLAFFAERIAGEGAEVSVLVGAGQSPHVYEPTPRQLAAVSSAQLFFGVGLPFEQRLIGKIGQASPGLKVVDAASGVARRPIESHEHDTHEGHDHPEGELDPHVWLSPLNAKVIARDIANALTETDPANSESYKKNLQALEAELDALHLELQAMLAPYQGRTFYVYHPAFGYFADAYGLKQEAIETGGKEPTARQLAEFISKAKKENVRVIFVQKQFPARAAESIAREIGGAVIQIDPLSRDYINSLRETGRQMQRAWQAQ